MSNMTMGEPVTVVTLNANGKPEFVEQKWLDVFKRDDAWNKPIGFLIVNGPTGIGKSLLLNILLHKHGMEENEGYQFLNPSMMFKSEKGNKGVTKGLMVWSKPFLVKDSAGNEVRVYLMDTEGLLLNGSPENKDVVIYALSAFLASVQVYFFDKYLKNSEMDYLEYMIKFSKKLLSLPNNSSYQTLMFLIRDWEMTDVLGLAEGTKYLNAFNAENPNHWNNVTSSYTTKNCMLMPYPGEGVVGKTFTGFTLAVPKIFKEKIEDLLKWVIKPGNVKPKIFNSKKATGEIFCKELKTMIEKINSTELPKSFRLVEYIEKRDLDHVSTKYFSLYQTQLKTFFSGDSSETELKLKQKHDEIKNGILVAFAAEIGGQVSNLTDLKSSLEKKIESLYKMTTAINAEIQNRESVETELETCRIQHENVVENTTKEMDNLKVNLQKTMNEKTSLENQLDEALTEFEMQRSKQEVSQKKIDNLTEELEEVNKENAALRGNLNHDRNTIETLNRNEIENENRIEQLTKKLDEFSYELKQNSLVISESENEVRLKTGQLRESEAQRLVIESELQVKSNQVRKSEKLLQEAEEGAKILKKQLEDTIKRVDIAENHAQQAARRNGQTMAQMVEEDQQRRENNERIQLTMSSAFQAEIGAYGTLNENVTLLYDEWASLREDAISSCKDCEKKLKEKNTQFRVYLGNSKNLVLMGLVLAGVLFFFMNCELIICILSALIAVVLASIQTIYSYSKIKTTKKNAKTTFLKTLQIEGNLMKRIQSTLEDMIKSQNLLARIEPFIEEGSLKDNYRSLTQRGQWRMEKLATVKSHFEKSQLFPDNEAEVIYSADLEETELGKMEFNEIRKTLQRELTKFNTQNF